MFKLLFKVAIFCVVFVMVSMIIGFDGYSSPSKDAKEEKKAVTTKEYFMENKKTIMEILKLRREEGKNDVVSDILHRYKDVNDSDLDSFKKQKANNIVKPKPTKDEETKSIIQRLKKIPTSETEKNLELYTRLLELHPNNNRYIKKRNYYLDASAKAVAKRIVFGDKPSSYGLKRIYSPVKRYLEKTMHNPRSLEFVGCTSVYEGKNGWIVGCDYRGTNGFGAITLESKWFTIQQHQVIKVEASDAYNIK